MTTRHAPKIVRRDSLPEHARYKDEGCELSPSCLRCPLPRCQYDERPLDYALTSREIAVLYLIADGEADKKIAVMLGIATSTVNGHVANILVKMGSPNRTEAAVRGVREGLLIEGSLLNGSLSQIQLHETHENGRNHDGRVAGHNSEGSARRRTP